MIDTNVLVLNRLWQAVNICSIRRAFALLYKGHARVVNEENGIFSTFNFENWKDFSHQNLDRYECAMIKTVHFKIQIPRIILLLIYDRYPSKDIKLTRHNIYERDHNTCQYCGKKFEKKDLNIDHVVPRDRGGITTWENVVCSCVWCNAKKANKTLIESRLHLIRKPKKPRWHPLMSLSLGNKIRHESWKHFIDYAYWNVELGE